MYTPHTKPTNLDVSYLVSSYIQPSMQNIKISYPELTLLWVQAQKNSHQDAYETFIAEFNLISNNIINVHRFPGPQHLSLQIFEVLDFGLRLGPRTVNPNPKPQPLTLCPSSCIRTLGTARSKDGLLKMLSAPRRHSPSAGPVKNGMSLPWGGGL